WAFDAAAPVNPGAELETRSRCSSMNLKVVLVKPSKYDESGHVQRFRLGYLPNSTLNHIRSMTPSAIDSGNQDAFCRAAYQSQVDPQGPLSPETRRNMR